MLIEKNKLSLEDELFCTRYELEVLSGIVNLGMLERWLPGFCKAQTHKEHILRYNWVKQFVENKTVLDIACGTGYGSFLLATEGNAVSVTGCDIDPKTIQYASFRNKHENLDFQVQNAESFSFNKTYDVVISFETIEHLEKPELFLQCVNQVLDVNGSFYISTPISHKAMDYKPENVYHLIEWGFGQFHEFVSKYFRIEHVFLQVYRSTYKRDARRLMNSLRRFGVFLGNSTEIFERLEPFLWNSEEIKQEQIGNTWTGYQVLKCNRL